MKALRAKISTYAVTLFASLCLTSGAGLAGSSDFAGIYAAMNASAGGAQINGQHVDNNGEISKGTVGAVFPMAGYEIGFNLPLGSLFFLGVGHSWSVGGQAEIADGEDTSEKSAVAVTGQDEQDNNTFSLTASNHKEVYLMPSLSIYDNAAVYVKWGRSMADLELTGSATGAPGNLMGDVLGVGTIAMTPSGIFIKTEGTWTSYDDIRIVGIGNAANSLVEGTPDIVQGTVALGFKF